MTKKRPGARPHRSAAEIAALLGRVAEVSRTPMGFRKQAAVLGVTPKYLVKLRAKAAAAGHAVEALHPDHLWHNDLGAQPKVDPTGRVQKGSDLAVRLWAHVDKETGPIHATLGRCWIWKGSVDGKGYGRITICRPRKKLERAHRAAWTVARGPIPTGEHVLHRCDTPPCVNPDHLFLGTHADNMEDKAIKRRTGLAKLTEDKVREIRRLLSEDLPLVTIAKRVGAHVTSVRNIRDGLVWKWVK